MSQLVVKILATTQDKKSSFFYKTIYTADREIPNAVEVSTRNSHNSWLFFTATLDKYCLHSLPHLTFV